MDVVQQDLYMFFSLLRFLGTLKYLIIFLFFKTEKKNESKVNENVEAEKMFLIFFIFLLSCNHDFIPQEN